MRGHLAAQIDPLGLNNMDKEKAKNMIIRSVTIEDKVRHKVTANEVLVISKRFFMKDLLN